tara:strand:- start:854 stop:1066 length:213 start_codon:yes stop_codon:yes gene_type:complete
MKNNLIIKKDENDNLGFEFNGIRIIDPFVSECSRFLVNPIKYYGLNESQLKSIYLYNKIDIKNYQGWETI